MSRWCLLAGLLALTMLTGCVGRTASLPTVAAVDLDRFMGDWYVIAHIPTILERNAFNAIERYEHNGDRINTTFSFRNKGFDGDEKTYRPNAVIRDPATNAEWGMQFIWPFRSDFRIVYLDESYGVTVIGRNKRDYVWIMARQPQLPEAIYDALVREVAAMGYETGKLRRVPQKWPEPA
ncbi:MAG: lipocalin family protein [Pseudomonadota bacterium]